MPDRELCDIPPTTHCQFADDAADRAVKKTFRILGVDVDDAAQVKVFQESLRFSEALSKLANKGMTAAVVTVIIFLVGATALGIKQKILGGP